MPTTLYKVILHRAPITYLLMLCCLLTVGQSHSRLDYGLSAGASNYLGDIGGKAKKRRDFVVDMKMAKTRWVGGAFVRYRLYRYVSFKAAFDYIRLEGDDKLSKNVGRRFRNANFRNDLFTLEGTAEWLFYDNNDIGNFQKARVGFTSYVFGGLGMLYHNPKAKYQGSWIPLRPLKTEGEKKPYKRIVLCIPLGLGAYYTINDHTRIGLEFSWRITFTDYLDDIKRNYPDDPSLLSAKSQNLALRTPELGQAAKDENIGAYLSHTWGAKRGDPTHRDSYMTLSVTYGYVIKVKNGAYRKRGKRRSTRKIRVSF